MLRRTVLIGGLLSQLAVAMPSARADAFPTRPLKLVLGFAPGGTSDQAARILQPRLEAALGQPVAVEYRTGASGAVSATYVAHAPADGYTLLLSSHNQLAGNVSLQKNLAYDLVRDFAPVGMIGRQANVLVIHPSLAAATLAELVSLVKANPGTFAFGSAGAGSHGHIVLELLRAKHAIDFTHVPYRGSAPAVQNVLAGHVQMTLSLLPPVLPHLRSGALRAIAVLSTKRIAALPDVPTFDESGHPGFVLDAWHGLMVPAGTPPAVVETLHRAMMAALDNPDVKAQFAHIGVELQLSSPATFAAFIGEELAKWAALAAVAGIKPD